jgi:glycosyltransferase involved in cell wall biosynthesis
LVQAFAAVAAHQPDVVLVLAGPDGPDAPAVRAAIEALPAATRERVRTMGFVDDGERAALLTAATVLAYPSLDEGFGLPMLEAWQHDVPVVAARAGALPEVADDAARRARGRPDRRGRAGGSRRTRSPSPRCVLVGRHGRGPRVDLPSGDGG